jgi:hypothetical protein
MIPCDQSQLALVNQEENNFKLLALLFLINFRFFVI